ncbi:MAG: hypothetical protein ACFFGZ_11370 [Candidatus Thorarchaeota archaeon]
MVEIFGIEIGLLAMVPAVFGAAMSAYNWYMMNRPADIHSSEILNFGFISSSYEEAMLFCFPLIFSNDGAKKGLITDIKIGFKKDGEITYIDLDGKARLKELDSATAPLLDWKKYQEEGYVILQPTYPIPVEAGASTDVTLMATVDFDEKAIPIGEEVECVIEVEFGHRKRNTTSFPFLLSEETAEIDDRLVWLKPSAE